MPITVMNHLTLDGVMQAPGRADEDTRGGFPYGGWAQADNDEVMDRFLGERMSRGGDGALLFGRRTYEDVLSFWNAQPENPFAPRLNEAPKYVASTTLTEPLPWPNSKLLAGDAVEAVASLKRDNPETSFGIMGSGALVRGLMTRDLVDEWLLMIHPLVLGTGLSLFGEQTPPARLSLVDTVVTTKGVLIATYHRTDTPV